MRTPFAIAQNLAANAATMSLETIRPILRTLAIDYPVFVNNDQDTYRVCPWGGDSELVAEDRKYQLYRTNRYNHKRKIGFYLVDNAPRRK